MRDDPRDERERQIDAYCDGRLGPAERAAFERRLAEDPLLRDAVERQRRIDEALIRLFPLPAAESLQPPALGRLDARPVEPAAMRSTRWRVWVGAAASVVLLAAVGSWWTLQRLGQADETGPLVAKPLDEIYRGELRRGFVPAWVCKDDAEFEGRLRARFGQGLLLATLPPGVRAVGWSYANAISPNTSYMLAEAGGQRMIVFVDHLKKDKGQAVPPSSGLHLFRRVVGALVLYELSPLQRPSLLDRFYDPHAADSSVSQPARRRNSK